MHVVYVCVEMLGTPAVARVLHAESFRDQYSGIDIDEAHTVHESFSWRSEYSMIASFAKICGFKYPLIPLSATLIERLSRYAQVYKSNIV